MGGWNGTIAHFDGSGWSALSTPTTATVLALWASAPDDVWASASSDLRSGFFMHYDGSAWTTVTPGTLHVQDIWGSAANDVWAASPAGYFTQGALYHFDGTTWTDATPSDVVVDLFRGVWGTASDNVFVTGQRGAGGGTAAYE